MKPSIILDHDIGTNPDDFFALLLLLNSPEVDLSLLISGNNYPRERAAFARKILDLAERADIPSLIGEATGTIDFNATEYIKDFSFNSSSNYIDEIKAVLDSNNQVTYIAIEGLSSLASFLKKCPEYIDTFDVVHMGLSLTGAEECITGGTNIDADGSAAKFIYELGLKRLRIVGSHTTINDSIRVTPETDLYKKLSQSNTPNQKMLFSHLQDYHKRKRIWPALHDPLVATVALGQKFVSFKDMLVTFDTDGQYKIGGSTQLMVSKPEIYDAPDFMKLMERIVVQHRML